MMTRTQLSTTKTGYIISDTDFADYGIKAGREYKVHTGDSYAFIWADGEIRIDNNEIRDDMLPHFTWSEK